MDLETMAHDIAMMYLKQNLTEADPKTLAKSYSHFFQEALSVLEDELSDKSVSD